MKILYSHAFIDDVAGISRYVEHELNNPKAATSLKSGFFDEIQRLKESPFLGEQLPSFLRVGNADLRRLVFKNYIIVYRVIDETVIAERIFYGRRDWISILLS